MNLLRLIVSIWEPLTSSKMKKILRICLGTLLAFSITTSVLADKEESSIDSISTGVADTGETKFGKAKGDIEASKAKYSVAVLPYVDASGLEGRSREMAVNAIKEALKTKYPNKGKVKVAGAKLVNEAMKSYPLENSDAPVLKEMVTLGQAMGVDRVIYINMLPVRQKETGFMVIAGSQTASAVVAMKLKCVDVKEKKYLFNQTVEDIGSSSSINFWKIGQPSKAKAVKRGTANCMRDFLTAFN